MVIFMDESLYQEAMLVADMYDIPKVIVNDFYEAFVEFVREELSKRIRYGTAAKINTDIFMQVVMAEANCVRNWCE